MSVELGAIVRRLFETWNAAAAEGSEIAHALAEVSELLDPEIEFVNPPEAIDPGVRRGVEGFITALTNLREFGVYQFDVARLVEDRDHVAVAVVQHAKAPGSGIQMTFPPTGALWSFREGRVVRLEWFVDPDDAFARLGQLRTPNDHERARDHPA